MSITYNSSPLFLIVIIDTHRFRPLSVACSVFRSLFHLRLGSLYSKVSFLFLLDFVLFLSEIPPRVDSLVPVVVPRFLVLL